MKKCLVFLFIVLLLSSCGSVPPRNQGSTELSEVSTTRETEQSLSEEEKNRVPSMIDILDRNETLISDDSVMSIKKEDLLTAWGAPKGSTRLGNDIWQCGERYLDVGYKNDLVYYIQCSRPYSGVVLYHDEEHALIYWSPDGTSFEDLIDMKGLITSPDRDALGQKLELKAGDLIDFQYSAMVQQCYPGKAGAFYSVTAAPSSLSSDEIAKLQEKLKTVLSELQAPAAAEDSTAPN